MGKYLFQHVLQLQIIVFFIAFLIKQIKLKKRKVKKKQVPQMI